MNVPSKSQNFVLHRPARIYTSVSHSVEGERVAVGAAAGRVKELLELTHLTDAGMARCSRSEANNVRVLVSSNEEQLNET